MSGADIGLESQSLFRITHLSTQSVQGPSYCLPDHLGHYHIKSLIGSGAMGTVYLATQDNPRRTVALKIMKRSSTSHSARRRFEQESQLLARLRHPGIAHVYEAGICNDSSGPLPYFAMEYIPNALRITRYADDHRLDTKARLQLFIAVCEAVHHGHQKGVIHRDLKPGNILVDSDGGPRVIDFGVARSTDADLAVTSQQTIVGELIGTVQYMSPEQCCSDPHDIDIRSDIYALGVVLHELLSGDMPYDLERTPVYEAIRVIREQPPRPLGTCDKSLRGDVETIVSCAMEKDRQHRYQSAHAMAEDIQRFLRHEPIGVRRPSVIYKLRKFVRRRRLSVLVMVGVVVALAFAIERQFAAARVKSMSAAVMSAYFEALNQTDESQRDPQLVVAESTHVIELHPELAPAYALRAKALFLLNRHDAAWPDCQRALELDPRNPLALRVAGFMHLIRGDFDAALASYDSGIESLSLDVDLPRDYYNRAMVHRIAGRYDLALADNDRAVILSNTAGPARARAFEGRGMSRRCLGDIAGAIEDFERAMHLDPTWRVQCNLWIWELRMLRDAAGDRAAAAAAIAAAAAAAQDPGEELYVAVCRGQASAEDVTRASRAPVHLCYGAYYLGARALIEGRSSDARMWFERCRGTGQHVLEEHTLAGWHLQQLATTE